MRKNKITIIIIYCILITALCGVVFSIFISKKSELIERNELLNKLDKELSITNSFLRDAYTIQFYNWILGVDSTRNIQLKNWKNDSLFLHDLLKNQTLVFYFESDMCEVCVDKEFLNLEDLANTFEKYKILIIASGFSSKYLFNHKKFAKWKSQIYLSKQRLYSEKNLTHTPTITLNNSKGEIFAAYHATKSNNKHFELFLNFLKKIENRNDN